MRAAVIAALLITAVPAGARDLGQWGQVSPKVRACFHDLRSPEGGMCCDGADGVKVEDPDWHQNADGSYSVTLSGAERKVDSGHVTDAGKCGAGYAIVWTYPQWELGSDKPTDVIRCFSPGTRS